MVLGGCSAPFSPPAPVTAPSASRPPSPSAASPAARPADAQSESDWRRALAQHILAVNREQVFEGRPPNPLKAVVVLELTVGADGRIQNASVMRAPDHARDLGPVAVRTARAASPLPPPPRALLGRGTSVRFTETWLFRQDNRFQLRTVAQVQL
jgi:protein TonB